ncbi:MAG: glucose-6-phosphate dehydrogenase [Gemmatimonadaceae bacterium]
MKQDGVRHAVRATRDEPRAQARRADPCTLVILGAGGDLMRRKLLPALYSLAANNLLPDDFTLLGAARAPLTDEEFRTSLLDALGESEEITAVDDAAWRKLSRVVFYVSGDLTEDDTYVRLSARLSEIERPLPASTPINDANRMIYLALPPSVFPTVVRKLSSSGVAPRAMGPDSHPWTRIVVEKPFGRDLASARLLNRALLELFDESQIFRIDHYLGKETVQNILVFRFANSIFEALWNRNHIAHVQITAAEKIGVGARAQFYEEAGVFRDMFQNHLLQLLALTAMEPPARADAGSIRDEKVKVLRSLVAPSLAGDSVQATAAQYAAGRIDGADVPGYRQESGVASGSLSPTFAAARFLIDNARWKGVPFYLRSGKRMARRVTEIAIQFRDPHMAMFGSYMRGPRSPNVLVLRIQPDEGIGLSIELKCPGPALALTPEVEVGIVSMDFDYSEVFGSTSFLAYETLLLDVMLGDATLFTRSDEVEVAWGIVDPLIRHWDRHLGARIPLYEAGSWGPPEAHELIALDGFVWREDFPGPGTHAVLPRQPTSRP